MVRLAGMRVWLLAAAAGVGVGVLVGCGHEKPRAAASPPPPAATAGKNKAPVLAGTPVPPVTPLEIPRGERPFSTEVGMASWYGRSGRRAANGEVFKEDGLSAASRTLPLGTLARVTNLVTGQVAVVRINDRGPFVPGRILDLSMGAAKATGLYRLGVAKVKVEAFATPEVVPGEGRWCIQIGAFADANDATRLKYDLVQRYGATAKVITFKGDTGSWVRLTFVVPDRDKAEQVAARMRAPDSGVEAYVTRTN